MNLRTQIIIGMVTFIIIGIIVNMVRKKQLELKYALSWMVMGLGVLILDCFPVCLRFIANIIDIAEPINMLFFMGFCFTLIILFILTITISRLSIQIKRLAQYMSLTEYKEKAEKENV